MNELLADGVPASTLQFTNLYFGAETTDPNTGLPLLPFDPVNNNAFFHAFEDETSGKSFYDGLQLQISEHNFHGLLMQFSYTYSHALDNSSDPLVPTLGNGNFPVNSFDLRREYGNSGTDVRHRAVLNFVYQAPVGRGTSHWNEGFVGRAFEGWELSGIAAFQTGLPYDIFNSDDNGGVIDTLHTGLADRATVVGSTSRCPERTRHSPDRRRRRLRRPRLSACLPMSDAITGTDPEWITGTSCWRRLRRLRNGSNCSSGSRATTSSITFTSRSPTTSFLAHLWRIYDAGWTE